MPAKSELEAQLQTAIRDSDDMHKRTLRIVLSEWKIAEVERGEELDEAAAISLFRKQAKRS